MTVTTVARAPVKSGAERDERKTIDARQADQFQAALRKRKRPAGNDDADGGEAPLQRAAPPSWAFLPQPMLTAASAGHAPAGPDGGWSGDWDRNADTGLGSPTAVEPAGGDAAMGAAGFPSGAQSRREGDVLHVRFTQGEWAGTELQAALQANQIVLTLRPTSARQHKTLTEFRASLIEEVQRETGREIKVEIADAAR